MTSTLAIRNNTQLAVRSQIEDLEASMKAEVAAGNMEQTLDNCNENFDQADHAHAKGVYARGLLIPAGTVVVGKLHKFSRVCVIASGKCTFINEFEKRTVTAPWMGEFKAGSKTAVFAHEDCYWVAVHGTDFTDSEDLLTLVADDHEEYHKYLQMLEED